MTLLAPHSVPARDQRHKYRVKVADFRKNSCERVEVRLEDYNDSDLVNIAVIRDDTGHALNRMKQTPRIVSLQVRDLHKLIAALQQAEAEAVKLGILHRGAA